jgi:hypothetical protein
MINIVMFDYLFIYLFNPLHTEHFIYLSQWFFHQNKQMLPIRQHLIFLVKEL